MEEKELFERYREAYDFLRKKNIYELRLYGRAVGVKRPTAKNKKNLIADIIKIGSKTEPIPEKSSRGAPPKTKGIFSYALNELEKLLSIAKDEWTEIKISQEELQRLGQLVFLGQYVMNWPRNYDDGISEYDNLADYIYRNLYIYETGVTDLGIIEGNEIADIRDRLYDTVKDYIELFENELWLDITAETIADKYFPITDYDDEQIEQNRMAEKLLKNKLIRSGRAAVNDDFRDLFIEVENRICKNNA